jgi:PilZ domain
MHTLRRRSPRRHACRAATIRFGGDALARDCLVINVSKGGVRLNVKGLDVPDEFVLCLSNDGIIQESACKVAWRSGDEVGAKFIAVVRRDFAEREKLSA